MFGFSLVSSFSYIARCISDYVHEEKGEDIAIKKHRMATMEGMYTVPLSADDDPVSFTIPATENDKRK